MAKYWLWIGAGLLVLLVGFSLPRVLIHDGVKGFRGDPLAVVVAERAYNAAWMLNDNPLARVLLPAARVQNVEVVPGSCPSGWPGYGEPDADYTTHVRFYTLFAIPGPTVSVSCGGRRWSWL